MSIIIFSNDFFNIYNFRYSLLIKILEKYPKSQIIIAAKFDGYQDLIKAISHKIKLIDLKIESRDYNLLKNIITLTSIFKCLIKFRPKLVISYTIKPNFYLCLIKFFYKFNLIINITGLGDVFINKNKKNIRIFSIYAKIISNADTIVCQNKYDRNLLINLNQSVKQKLQIIRGSGVNTNKFRKRSILINNEKIVFTFIGRIIKEKGIIEFLNAVIKFNRIYPNKAKFLILGSLYKNNSLFNKKFQRYLKISKISHITNSNKINKFIENSHFIVLPSYREGLSKVLLEAISIGRPLITSNVPGCSELVIDRVNGYLLNKISSEEILKAFKKSILLNQFKLSIMSNKSNLISRKYTEEIVNYSYTLLIEKYIN